MVIMEMQSEPSINRIELKWQGPIKVGQLSSSLAANGFDKCHVYACVMRYPDVGLTAAYVGRCTNLRERIRGHLRDTLSMGYWLRDERAEWRYNPKDWPSAFDALDECLPLAISEVRRYEFYAAPCDPAVVNKVEGRLIRLLREQSGESLRCDNTRSEKDDTSLVVTHYADAPQVKQLVLRLFGEGPFG